MKVPGFLVLFLCVSFFGFGQALPELSLGLAPGGSVPLGENSAWFSFGGASELSASLDKVFPLVSPRVGIGYDYIPLRSRDAVHLLHAGAGVVLPFQLSPAIRLSPYAMGGYTYGMISDGSGQGGGPFVKGGVQVTYALSKLLSIGLDASYRWDIGSWGGIGISLYSGVSLPVLRQKAAPPPRIIKGLELVSANLSPVFPALFKLYDTNPIGSVRLQSVEKEPLSDVAVDFFVASYMDNPTRVFSAASVDAGGQVEVPLKALFSEQILKITEATKVSAKISVSFQFNGQPYTREFTQTLSLNNRNNIVWDDTRKAAAFVTPNDPLVLTLAKSAVSVTGDVNTGQIDPWLLAAMAVHEALRVKGQRYSVDPSTPFDRISGSSTALDTVYFPPEALAYGAGELRRPHGAVQRAHGLSGGADGVHHYPWSHLRRRPARRQHGPPGEDVRPAPGPHRPGRRGLDAGGSDDARPPVPGGLAGRGAGVA